MGKIFVLIGPSCSGKDTILKSIKENTDLIPLVLYTPRPLRNDEVNGETYNFITRQQYNELRDKGHVLEKREFETTKGNWLYATCDVNMDLENYNYITTNSLEGYQKLKSNAEIIDSVIPLYISVSQKNRMERAVKREAKQETPNYEELCRRFMADVNDFSPIKIEGAQIPEDCIFDNNGDINDTISNIIERINKELNKNRTK